MITGTPALVRGKMYGLSFACVLLGAVEKKITSWVLFFLAT